MTATKQPGTLPVTREAVAAMVERASDGEVPAVTALSASASLAALGVSSLGFLRLVDMLEETYGVAVDLAAARTALATVDAIVAMLAAQGVETAAPAP